MFSQTFNYIDILFLFGVVLIEIFLSLDNALIFAGLTSRFSRHKRKKLFLIGIGCALIIRILGIVFFGYLLQFLIVQFIGWLFLLYMSIHHFCQNNHRVNRPKTPPSYWKTIISLESLDIIFATDSILSEFGLINMHYPIEQIFSKMWILYFGGIIGLCCIRCIAYSFRILMDRWKFLETIAFLFVAAVGIKLCISGSIELYFMWHAKK